MLLHPNVVKYLIWLGLGLPESIISDRDLGSQGCFGRRSSNYLGPSLHKFPPADLWPNRAH